METIPLVSVCMITYKHEEFIAQALDGILKQRTDFDFDVVVGEDFSPDGTKDVLQQYANKYPKKVKVLYRDKNLGMMGNLIDTISHCHGKYIAFCEGDDFWTDPRKLQIQVDFLEKNPDYALCGHDVKCLKGKKKYRNNQQSVKTNADLKYLLRRGNYMPTLSVVYRNFADMIPFLEKFRDAPFGDYLMRICNAEHGRIHYMKKKMAVYRAHSGGVWSNMTLEQGFFKNLHFLEMIYDRCPEYQADLKIQLIRWLESVIRVKELTHLSGDHELNRIMGKMGVPIFMIEYLKFNLSEKSHRSYYAANVSFQFLLLAAKDKLVEKIFWKIRS